MKEKISPKQKNRKHKERLIFLMQFNSSFFLLSNWESQKLGMIINETGIFPIDSNDIDLIIRPIYNQFVKNCIKFKILVS